MSVEKAYPPDPDNIGKPCEEWFVLGNESECTNTAYGLMGRTSCGGVIDNVCLNVLFRRPIENIFTRKLVQRICETHYSGSMLPPGSHE